ncbi:MAG: class I SAM-dependent methyltransferase [Spirochaetales bacterium]|nr:class I SAM-dependent methyltransferase [Spirochaetales bacterium]
MKKKENRPPDRRLHKIKRNWLIKKFMVKTLTGIVQLKIVDILLLPFVFISALFMLVVRLIGFKNNRLNLCKKTLMTIGVMPVRNHYYEPFFDKRKLKRPLSESRPLPGIDWNIEEQLSLLNQFHYNEEFENIPDDYYDEKSFHFNNDYFESGDAEYWYNLIRLKKPKTIVEIGCGYSTKMAILALNKNKEEDKKYRCEHICIEPYEVPWLEELDITVIREMAEDLNKGIFNKLENDDILFIDSSHVIRPQGDVLFEYLELLPVLNNGVIVHVHDILTPKDYPEQWVIGEVKFWNEQYLLEAFLTFNSRWKILGALNFLHSNYYEKLKEKCPRLTPLRWPGSMYMVKREGTI